MRAGINYVCIKSPRTREELISGIYTNRDGKLLISDYTHNKPNQSGAHKCQYGEVIDVGTLWYDREDSRSMSWKTTNEIKSGDTAIYYFNDDAWNGGRYYVDGNTVYFFIKYESIYFVIRDKKIIPVNGYVLTEPIDDVELYNGKYELNRPQNMGNMMLAGEKEKKLIVLDGGKSKTYGYVRHIGTPLEETRITPFHDEVIRLNGTKFTGYGLKEGDFVFYPRWCAKPIMYDTQNFVGELYAQHRFGIHCVIEDPSKVTLKENSKHVKYDNPYEMSSAEIEQAQREWAKFQKEQQNRTKTQYFT